MSLAVLRRAWQRFMKPTYLVGRDLEGNKYYEYPNTDEGRSKRTVQYKRTDDMWAYVATGRRLPVQWTAWLTHTRPSPPSIEELQADVARQHRVQINAAILEARDREERACMAPVAQPSGWQVPGGRGEEPARKELATEKCSDSPAPPVRDPWAEAKRGSDEPQSWTPVVRR